MGVTSQSEANTDVVLAITNTGKSNWKNKRYDNRQEKKKDYSKVSCYCCGVKGHTKTICRFRDTTCHSCHRKGHLKKMCRNEDKNEDNKHHRGERRVHHLHKTGGDEDDVVASTSNGSQDNFFCLQSESDVLYKAEHQCKSEYPGKPMHENVIVNGMNVCMEIDTVTYVTVI